MKQKKILNTALASALLMCAACSQNNSGAPNHEPTANETSLTTTHALSISGKPLGEIVRQPRSATDIQQDRQQYQLASITDIPLDPKFNAQLFRIAGPDSLNKVYLAPKTYVYGSAEGVATITENADGTITVPFNIALATGLNPTLAPAQGGSGAPMALPDALKIKNKEELYQYVDKTQGQNAVLTPIIGCPKKITITAAGKEFDATPKLFKEGDICEIEKPFTVSITVNKSDLINIYEAIDQGYADVFVRFQTRVPVTTAAVHAEFDRDRLFEQITAKLQAQYSYYAQADIELAIQKVLAEAKANVYIVGNQTEQMKNLIDNIMREFFQTWAADPKVSGHAQCKSTVCLSVKYVKNQEHRSFRASWTETSPFLVDMNFVSIAKLRSASEIRYEVGGTQVPFSNYGSTTTSTLALSPNYGDIIVFKPTDYKYDDRRSNEREVKRNEYDECTNRVYYPGGSYCGNSEHRVEIWHSIGHAPLTNMVALSNIMSQAPGLLSGIDFQFRFTNGQTVTCPLLSMMGSGIDGGRVLRIINNEGCKLFAEGRTKISALTLVNRIQHPSITYTTGTRYSANFRNSNSNYGSETYNPGVNLQIELRHRTRVIMSDSSKVELK